MLDIRFIRDHLDQVKDSTAKKGYTVDFDALMASDVMRREVGTKLDEVRAARNTLNDAIKQGRPADDLITQSKVLKAQEQELDDEYKKCSSEFNELINQVPNLVADDVPVGGEEDSVTIKEWGDRATGAIDHLDFAIKRDWLDFERGAKVAGAKFYYLKGDLALLENAITQYALNFLMTKGFTYLTVPAMVNDRIATGTGFAPRTSDQSDSYNLADEDLTLIATAEIPITGYHADEILDEKNLPLYYVGLSPSFRKEAGTYGKHARGLFRVHQFNKLEMYAFTTPEQSLEAHARILALEEEIWQALGVPYRVINIASGDLGAPAVKKYDIEYWSPVDGTYRELTSCSNCTDFQARNLNIRARGADGAVRTVHTLNGTAVSLARSLIAVIEHYQNPDGTLRIPEVLRPYLSDRTVL